MILFFFCGNDVTVEGTVVFLLTEYSKWGITRLLLTTLHWPLKSSDFIQCIQSLSLFFVCFNSSIKNYLDHTFKNDLQHI